MLIRIFISICNIPFYLSTVFVLYSSEISMENILYHGYKIYDFIVKFFHQFTVSYLLKWLIRLVEVRLPNKKFCEMASNVAYNGSINFCLSAVCAAVRRSLLEQSHVRSGTIKYGNWVIMGGWGKKAYQAINVPA